MLDLTPQRNRGVRINPLYHSSAVRVQDAAVSFAICLWLEKDNPIKGQRDNGGFGGHRRAEFVLLNVVQD
jgi:hypothetical protein